MENTQYLWCLELFKYSWNFVRAEDKAYEMKINIKKRKEIN